MTAANNPTSETADRELVISRILDAPRLLVWQAWIDPQRVAQWWGPHGMTTPVCQIDLRPGGIFRTVMRDPNGVEYPNTLVFLEIRERHWLVFTDAFVEDWTPSEHAFMTVKVTFEDLDGKTVCTAQALHWSAADRAAHEQMGFHQGWGESFERFAAVVTQMKGNAR